MNTGKQINVMVALVFIAVLTAGAYTLWDPGRASDAKVAQLNKTLDRGAFLFAENCRACHGNAGQGGATSNRLAAALALNRPDLQGRTKAGGPVDANAKINAYKRIYYTIACGRIGTAMPTWGDTQGGTLNAEQIKQLTTLITEGTAWDVATRYSLYGYPQGRVAGEATDGLTLAKDLDANSTTVYLNKTTSAGAPVVSKGDRLQITPAGQPPSDKDEIMAVTAVNTGDNSATVERPVGTTKAVAHKAGDAVEKPAIPPEPAAITGKDTLPTCGQNPPRAVASPTPGGAEATPTAAAASASVTLVGENSLFDKQSLVMPAGVPLTITFDHRDAGVSHNVDVFKGTDNTGESVAKTAIEVGPVTQTLNFGPLEAGTYYYQCDVHPTTMFGTLTVR